VDHPAEDDGMEAATCGVTGFLRSDGAAQTESGPVRGTPLLSRGHAKVGVQMPSGDAQGETSVQLVFAGALRHGVHGAHQFEAR